MSALPPIADIEVVEFRQAANDPKGTVGGAESNVSFLVLMLHHQLPKLMAYLIIGNVFVVPV
jgi:hypothetical protein